MQENARGTYESGDSARGMQGNAVEHRGMPRERMGVECARGMLGNAGYCQGNLWEWVQTARGMQGNAGECQGNVW